MQLNKFFLSGYVSLGGCQLGLLVTEIVVLILNFRNFSSNFNGDGYRLWLLSFLLL